MELCIPCFKDGQIYSDAELKKPRAGVIATTYETLQEKGEYPAMCEFVAGGIESLLTIDGKVIDDKIQIKNICKKMPYITAETMSLQIMALVNKDDWIEGVYSCPRCHQKIITGVSDFEDTRDCLTDLEIINMGEDENGNIDPEKFFNNIHVDLECPVKIVARNTNETIEEITSLDMAFPTIDDCIIGMNKYPEGRDVKQQFFIYATALTKINDQEITLKWRRMWGEFLFKNMDPDDIAIIGKQLLKYGMKKTIKRTCRNCGKVWNSPINTSNFFVSGLQSV